MREILFKAKRFDNGEWIEGCYFKCDGRSFICSNPECNTSMYMKPGYWMGTFFEIDPTTVCQYTGLCDKNGKRIWENDVVWLVCDGKEHIYQIVWDNSELNFKATKGEENYGTNYEYLLCCDEIEVIGNIFDNKELLQEESDE